MTLFGTATLDLNSFSQQLLRSVTKDLSRDAEKIAKAKINERLGQGNSNQSVDLDIQHTFRISNGSADITFKTSYEKIKGEQRDRVRAYSYTNKNGKKVHVKGHNRINKDNHRFETENGGFTTSDELPDETINEIFSEAVQEAVSGAFRKLKL